MIKASIQLVNGAKMILFPQFIPHDFGVLIANSVLLKHEVGSRIPIKLEIAEEMRKILQVEIETIKE